MNIIFENFLMSQEARGNPCDVRYVRAQYSTVLYTYTRGPTEAASGSRGLLKGGREAAGPGQI